MALTDFAGHYDNAYEDYFQKVIISKKIANFRFEKDLKYGSTVTRFSYNIDNVRVRTVTRNAASTIDTITDTTEVMTVNIEKEAVFPLSDGEMKQAGPLNPGEVIGKQVAIKVAVEFDGTVFAEVLNATYAFDTGDLTTLSSNGTPITESSTTVPQMSSRMPAKLKRYNQTMSNMAFVTDAIGVSNLEQYLMSKNINLAGSVFANGYTGTMSNGADIYASENLTGEAVLSLATQPTNGDTLTINGVVINLVTTIGSTAGNVLVQTNVDTTRANIAGLINNPGTTSATQVALSAEDQLKFTDTLRLVATNSNSADTLTIVGTGSGALIVSETLTDATDTWTKNFIHAYFGRKGAIDVVMQDISEVDIRPCSDRRGNNIFNSYLAAVKTFADGAKKFLNVKLAR